MTAGPTSQPTRRRRALLPGAVVAGAVLLAACAPVHCGAGGAGGAQQAPPGVSMAAPTRAQARAPGVDGDAARRSLATLPVKGRAPRTGYAREQFGPAWADVDRNGCDTRNDILRRDLTGVVLKEGTAGCVVMRGVLGDPYSGRLLPFQRGERTSGEVQIDHVVALSDAWQKGAARWSEARRRAFANDPRNLLAVDGRLNAQKGDGDAATWLPPQRSYRCAYAARQIAVKAAYALSVTRAEHDALLRLLGACPS